MPDSVRKLILLKMLEAFRAVAPPPNSVPPSDDDWPLKFSVVELGPLDPGDHKKRYSIGIVPQNERYRNDQYPLINRNLSVAVEYRVTVNQGDGPPGLLAEDVMAVVERVLIENRFWDGLAIDTQLTGNETDMSNYQDKTVMGAVYVEISYRHSILDPRDPNPAFGT